MKTNRRKFISTAVVGGLAATALPLSSYGYKAIVSGSQFDVKSRYAKLDEILKKPVFKREYFPDPVIIKSYCRPRSKLRSTIYSRNSAK